MFTFPGADDIEEGVVFVVLDGGVKTHEAITEYLPQRLTVEHFIHRLAQSMGQGVRLVISIVGGRFARLDVVPLYALRLFLSGPRRPLHPLRLAFQAARLVEQRKRRAEGRQR